jgi:hypothetical protein
MSRRDTQENENVIQTHIACFIGQFSKDLVWHQVLLHKQVHLLLFKLKGQTKSL